MPDDPRAEDPRAAADHGQAMESIRVVMRNYLSTHHLYAARYSAESAEGIEASHPGGTVFDIRLRGHVMGAVMESVAFLEATINEVFQDAAHAHHSYVGGLGDSCLRLMSGLWAASGQGFMDVLDKFDLALLFAGKEPFDKGRSPYQEARLLVRLRNYLVHYRPEDVSADSAHRLGQALRGKFGGSVLMVGAGNPWFPDHALGAGCAAWAWRSARAHTDTFADEMGLTLNYQRADFGDALPR